MPEAEKKPQAAKKAIEVPKTESSKTADKATKLFVYWMIALIAAVALGGGLIIYWQVNAYITQSNKNKAQDIQIGDLQTKQQNLIALKPNYEKIIAPGANGSSDADLILRALPVDKGYDELVAMIEKMAAQSGIKVTSVSQSDATGSAVAGNGSAPQPYNFSVTLEGGYNGILEFLRKTENSARVIDFSSMNLSGNSATGANQASITMKTYFQPPANINPTQEPLQ